MIYHIRSSVLTRLAGSALSPTRARERALVVKI